MWQKKKPHIRAVRKAHDCLCFRYRCVVASIVVASAIVRCVAAAPVCPRCMGEAGCINALSFPPDQKSQEPGLAGGNDWVLVPAEALSPNLRRATL